eukprot:CFRG7236T1
MSEDTERTALIQNGNVVTHSVSLKEETSKCSSSVYTHENKNLLWLLVAAMFFTAIPISILAPFFPKYAAEIHHMTPEQIGWCFAVFPLTSLICSPMVPYIIGLLGRSNLLACAIAFSATSTVAFGFGNSTFSFFLARIVQGVSCSAAMTCCTATLALVFHEHSGEVFGLVEMTFGAAFMVGPPIGGAVYALTNSFWAPFVVTSLPALVIVPLTKLMMRKIEAQILDDSSERENQATYVQIWVGLLRLPRFMFVVVEVVAVSISYSCLEPIFAPHLTELHPSMNAGHIGLVFVLQSTFYIVGTIITGKLSDRFPRMYLMAIGCVVTMLGFSLLAPVPFLYIDVHLIWPVCVGMILLGFGTSLALVPSMPMLVDIAISAVGEDDMETTTDIVSSLFNMAFSLGESIGPIVATTIQRDYNYISAMSSLLVVSLICHYEGLGIVLLRAVQNKNPTRF